MSAEYIRNEIISFLRCHSDSGFTFQEVTRKLDFRNDLIFTALSDLLVYNKIELQYRE